MYQIEKRRERELKNENASLYYEYRTHVYVRIQICVFFITLGQKLFKASVMPITYYIIFII
jgi:hypothetical protein